MSNLNSKTRWDPFRVRAWRSRMKSAHEINFKPENRVGHCEKLSRMAWSESIVYFRRDNNDTEVFPGSIVIPRYHDNTKLTKIQFWDDFGAENLSLKVNFGRSIHNAWNNFLIEMIVVWLPYFSGGIMSMIPWIWDVLTGLWDRWINRPQTCSFRLKCVEFYRQTSRSDGILDSRGSEWSSERLSPIFLGNRGGVWLACTLLRSRYWSATDPDAFWCQKAFSPLIFFIKTMERSTGLRTPLWAPWWCSDRFWDRSVPEMWSGMA